MARNTQQPRGLRSIAGLCANAIVASVLRLAPVETARADEGGTGFWVPGQYASLAALSPSPGWSITTTLYYLERKRAGLGWVPH